MTTPEESAALLHRVRDEAPLVQCITNVVVANVTANVLLAVGAAPAMVDIIGEAGLFARLASGLLVNTGTPRIEQREAAREAVAAAVQAGTPWVLDPVAIGSLPIRTALARDLSIQGPSAVRGNPAEVIALAGLGSGGRGVDSSGAPDAAAPAAKDLARRLGTVVAASGSHDFITDGVTTVDVANGHPLLTRMTGGGCALGALVAAFLAARGEHSALAAVTAAHVVHGLSAERAAMTAAGPGSFAVALLDQLAELTPDDVAAGARITHFDGGAR